LLLRHFRPRFWLLLLMSLRCRPRSES